MTTPQDRLTIEGLRQTVAHQAATIATLRAAYAAQLNLTIEAKGEIDTLRADLALADTTAANLHDEIRKRDEAIATLRAALDLAVKTIEWTQGFVLDEAMETWERGTRAALATAKETP